MLTGIHLELRFILLELYGLTSLLSSLFRSICFTIEIQFSRLMPRAYTGARNAGKLVARKCASAWKIVIFKSKKTRRNFHNSRRELASLTFAKS